MSFWCKTKDICLHNCGVRVNALITALVPALDYASSVLPLLREHLPADVYSMGFVAMALVNILLHIRVPTGETK